MRSRAKRDEQQATAAIATMDPLCRLTCPPPWLDVADAFDSARHRSCVSSFGLLHERHAVLAGHPHRRPLRRGRRGFRCWSPGPSCRRRGRGRCARPARRARSRRWCAGRPLTLSIRPTASMSNWPFRSSDEVGQLVLGGPQVDRAAQRLVEQRGDRLGLAEPRAGGAGAGGELRPLVQTVPMWALSSSSPFGRVTETRRVFASPGFAVSDRVDRRMAAALDAAGELERQLRFVGQAGAVGDLEAARCGPSAAFVAGDRRPRPKAGRSWSG